MHLALVQPLYRAQGSSKFKKHYHLQPYMARLGMEYFAGLSRSVRFLHLHNVYIFNFSFPIVSFLYAPCLSVTIVPGVR